MVLYHAVGVYRCHTACSAIAARLAAKWSHWTVARLSSTSITRHMCCLPQTSVLFRRIFLRQGPPLRNIYYLSVRSISPSKGAFLPSPITNSCHRSTKNVHISCASGSDQEEEYRESVDRESCANTSLDSDCAESRLSQTKTAISGEHPGLSALYSNCDGSEDDTRSQHQDNDRAAHSDCSGAVKKSTNVTPLMRQLSARIRATGAITVAQFMAELLANPTAGYYTRHADIGVTGDFITAPELTPVYGELIGVWLYHEWRRLGSPQPVQLVEMGPGRGSLIADILHVWNQLTDRSVDLSVCLVENSCEMLLQQINTLAATDLNIPLEQITSLHKSSNYSPAKMRGSYGDSDGDGGMQQLVDPCDQLTAVSRCGRQLRWYSRLSRVPEHFSLLVANEFLDTMPTHQFRRTHVGWREVLVDTRPDDDLAFTFVLAPGPTAALSLITDDDVCGGADRDQLEISPRGDAWLEELACRLHRFGGIALLVDYGPDQTPGDARPTQKSPSSYASQSVDEAVTSRSVESSNATTESPPELNSAAPYVADKSAPGIAGLGDSLRAFRAHRCVDPLLALGTADVTCDVNMWRVQRRLARGRCLSDGAAAVDGVSAGVFSPGTVPALATVGPVTQAHFLTGLGVRQRFQALMAAHPIERERLQAVERMLVDSDMGHRFKVLAVYPEAASPFLQQVPPAPGF